MNSLGDKIKEIRNRKGLSQEELVEFSHVNLRTIQRIEKNENEPRGKTLKLICDVLDVDMNEIFNHRKHPDKSYLIFFHISVISFLVIPMGNIILPLILWMINKNTITNLQEVGARLLNYQIVWSILAYSSIIFFAISKVLHWGDYTVFLYLYFTLVVLNIVLPLFFARKTYKGFEKVLYPGVINFVK